MWVALVLLGAVAALAWLTMDRGRLLYFTWIALGFFAFRIVLQQYASRNAKRADTD